MMITRLPGMTLAIICVARSASLMMVGRVGAVNEGSVVFRGCIVGGSTVSGEGGSKI